MLKRRLSQPDCHVDAVKALNIRLSLRTSHNISGSGVFFVHQNIHDTPRHILHWRTSSPTPLLYANSTAHLLSLLQFSHIWRPSPLLGRELLVITIFLPK